MQFKEGTRILSTILIIILLLWTPGQSMGSPFGKVIDRLTGNPIKGAIVGLNHKVVLTDENGFFPFQMTDAKLSVRAYGYKKTEELIKSSSVIPIAKPGSAQVVSLVPFTPKGLYLSFYGIGDRSLRESALKLAQENELNALVIDVKGDRGMIPYKSTIPLSSEIGGQRIITVRDVNDLMRSLKEKGIYTIARIVVFKDNLLATAKPELAVKNQRGEIWRDRENLAWVDPFMKEVWNYNIEIAIEAAQLGFDEIQFDYVRFPDDGSPVFSMPNTLENRVRAVTGFLSEAKNRLTPYNVYLGADVFGYVFWNQNDTNIGQRLEDLAPHVDYLCPMLYPSGFQYGIPGYRIPVMNPYEIVYLTLKRAQQRANLPSVRFRPWLQAFRDYAFDKRYFGDREISEQIHGANQFGSHGWMLWNPGNTYTSAGLRKERFQDRLVLSSSRDSS
jgi:hypothetical protein